MYFILLLNLFFSDAKNMARDVHSILIDIAQANGNMTLEQATAFIKELTQKGRYSQDVWS
jgi:sulfite reductase alpha subunit-like flavoprotein